MAARRSKKQVPDGDRVGQTNRFLKLPFVAPRDERQIAANMRQLEQWGNNLPVGGGSGVTVYPVQGEAWNINGSWIDVPILTSAPSSWEYVMVAFEAWGYTEGDALAFYAYGAKGEPYSTPGVVLPNGDSHTSFMFGTTRDALENPIGFSAPGATAIGVTLMGWVWEVQLGHMPSFS